MHMVASTKQLLHISFGHFFAKNLVLLLGDFFEQLTTPNILHDQIDIFFIDIGFIIFDDIGMVQLGKYPYFLLNSFEMILELVFIQNFNRHLMLSIMLIMGEKDFTKCSRAQNFGVIINLIIKF